MLLLAELCLAQKGAENSFSITITFDSKISLSNIQVHYFETDKNDFDIINYKVNTEKNQIELFGHHKFVVGSFYFPTIIFTTKNKLKREYSNEENEVEFSYYLVTNYETYYKDEPYKLNFDKEIYFEKDQPNIIVNTKRVNKKIEFYIEKSSNLKFNQNRTSNTKVKINEMK